MRSTKSRITAPTKATTIAVMIGWPLIWKLTCRISARTPPMKAPSTPATRPTRIQTSTVSTSRRMSITSLTPYKQTAAGSRSCGLGGQVLQDRTQDAVEGRERMDHICERLQRSADLQGEHQLAEDLNR